MTRTVHLGYKCPVCRSRVPVYTFTSSHGNGSEPCTPPVDRQVECPGCHAGRCVPFSEILTLERWEEAAKGAAA